MIEDELKSGRLKGLVATSVAGARHRHGRGRPGRPGRVAGCGVAPGCSASAGPATRSASRAGARSSPSTGPTWSRRRSSCDRMHEGLIEHTRYPRNPLDVLAQQIVAMCALDEWTVDDLAAPRPAGGQLRRAVTDEVFDAVLDLLAGRYPSEEFAELRPRIVWDRVDGTVRGRAGAQRLAVTSGGTIPDRGPVRRVPPRRHPGRRARRGDGLREPAGRDLPARRVDVADRGHHPRAGRRHARRRASRARCRSGTATVRAGRSSSAGRSASSCGRSARCRPRPATERLRRDARPRRRGGHATCSQYLDEQAEATGGGARRPHDRRRALPRRDRRLAGLRARRRSAPRCTRRGPWRCRPGWPSGGASTSSSCGATTASCCACPRRSTSCRSTSCSSIPTRSTTSSSRSCPAPRCSPPGSASARRGRCCCPGAGPTGARRCGSSASGRPTCSRVAAKLPDVPDPAGGHPRVPATTCSTSRRCARCCATCAAAKVRVVPGRHAAGVAVRPVAAVRLDRRLHVRGRRAAGRAPGRRPGPRPRPAARPARRRGAARAARRRRAGRPRARAAAPGRRSAEPATPTSSTTCCACSGPLTRRRASRPARSTRRRRRHVDGDQLRRPSGGPSRSAMAGEERLRRGRGRRPAARRARRAPCPLGLPAAFTDPVDGPLRRPGGPLRPHPRPVPHRSRSPARFGVGVDRVRSGARRARGRRPGGARASSGPSGVEREWCDDDVLRQLRRRSLAALRREVEPVEGEALARFLPAWQGVGAGRRGLDGLVEVLGMLQGAALPASVLEADILPARLAELPPGRSRRAVHGGRGGVGRGRRPRADRRPGPAAVPRPGRPARPADGSAGGDDRPDDPLHAALLDHLARGARRSGPSSSQAAADRGLPYDDADVLAALWDLVWAGVVTNDSLAPLRALVVGPAGGGASGRAPAGRAAGHGPGPGGSPGSARRRARGGGRWSRRCSSPAPSPTEAAHARALPAARALRRADPRGRPGRGRRGRLRRRLPGAEGARRSAARCGAATSSPAWARPSSPCPAPSTGCGRSGERGDRRRPTAPSRSCSPPPIRPSRTAPRCRGPTGPRGGRPARPGGRSPRGAGRGRPGAVRRAGRAQAGHVPGRRDRRGWPARPAPAGWSEAATARSRSARSTARRCGSTDDIADALRAAGFVEGYRGLVYRPGRSRP